MKKKGMPMAVQCAFLEAFAGFSFMQLCDMWRAPGFWKAFCRSTHMNKLVLKQVAAIEAASVAATSASTVKMPQQPKKRPRQD